MIVIANSFKITNKEYTQIEYDKTLNEINMGEVTCSCGKTGVVKIGSYQRCYKTSNKRIYIKIQRVYCKHCGHSHAIFTECMVPGSMLLVETQVELLQSYYNHSLNEFLNTYPTIDYSNAIYIINNFKKKWGTKLIKARLSLFSPIHEIVCYFLENENIQFMQMKNAIFKRDS